MWVHGPVIPVLTMAQASPTKRSFLRWIYQRAPLVVFGSRAGQDSFEQFTWPDGAPPAAGPQLRTVIHNATAIDRTGLQHGHPEATVHIGFVGRLSAEKQPLQLLNLLDQLPEHFVLHVVGNGPLMTDMQRQGQPHMASGRLHLHGAQAVTASTYMAWQATVLCSAYEGYPMTALESLACGVPCVSLPIPAMRELYDLDAPYLLARGDAPVSLAEAVMTVLSLPEQQVRDDIARIVARHHIDGFVGNWQEVLRTC